MAKEEKLRCEIEDKYKWDLTKIYKDEKEWQKDFDDVKEKILKVLEYKDSFLSNGKKLYEYLKYDEEVSRKLEKIYYYAHLNYDADTLDEKYKVMTNRVSDLFTKYNELSSFVVPEILKLDEEKLNTFYKDEEKLEDYRFSIENIYRFKNHTLDEEKEKMLSNLSKCLSNPEETYEALTDSDFEYDYITDEKGNKVKFNESNYSLFIKSKDRSVRKRAFEMLHNKYKKYIRTITSTYKGEVETNVVLAKIRNYDSAISASLYSDNVPVDIYNNLIKVVNDNMDALYDYYDLKKEILSLDRLHMYDTYVEIINKIEEKFKVWKKRDVNVDIKKAEFKSCFLTKNKDIEQVNLAMSLEAVPIESDKEVYALAVINTVFGGSISSRLFQKIREEKGLVYSIYSSQSLYRKCGELGIFASMSNEHLKEVYESIIEEIKIIKKYYLTDQEIKESKEQLKGSYILGLESTSSRMMSIGRALLLNNKVESTDDILKSIDNVDRETVKIVIDKIFNLDKLGVCIVGRDVEENKL